MGSPLPREARFHPKPRLLLRELAGEAVLLDLDRSLYFGLNGSGLRAWRLLAAGETVAGTLAALQAEFSVPAEELRADIEALVGELEAAGLLLRGDVEAAPAGEPASQSGVK